MKNVIYGLVGPRNIGKSEHLKYRLLKINSHKNIICDDKKELIMLPNLEDRTQDLVQMFLDRKIFKTQQAVIEKALDLLVEHQVNEESKHWDEESQTPIAHILSQQG